MYFIVRRGCAPNDVQMYYCCGDVTNSSKVISNIYRNLTRGIERKNKSRSLLVMGRG